MRLIDADKLKEHIDKLPALPDGNFAGNHSALKALINMQPTIEERKTGKWIHDNTLKQFFCSECGDPSLTDDDRYFYSMNFPNYCPNCGARMQEGEDNGK